MIGSLSTNTPSQSKMTSSKRLAIIPAALRIPPWAGPLTLILLQSAGQQFATPVEDRIGSCCQMSVDPLEVAHDVEEKLAHFNGLCPAGARPSEVFFGCACFDLPEDFLFAKELARRARVFGHEHGRRGARVTYQPLHHFLNLMATGFREANATFDAFGGKRHQALLRSEERRVGKESRSGVTAERR